MDDKLKVFWNLDVLVKMCRSKSDGPSLRIEETDIEEKIKAYKQEIDEIKALSEEDNYDTSAEMADRNIEIITKRQIQTLKAELKEKNKTLNNLKEEEIELYDHTSLLRETKASQEKLIFSMQERINESVDTEIIDRYNSLIAEATEKVASLQDELEIRNESYDEVQKKLLELTEEIEELEEKIEKKKKLLSETQANLENKDNYIDKSKREKNNKRIVDLENKIQKLNTRLEEIKKDPKYLESKIKDVINNKDDISKAKKYLVELINQVIKVPYINVPADINLEEELLRATQARDSFANEIDQKSYNILEADTPEKIRIEFLRIRIDKWQEELERLREKIALIDKDQQFDYENKNSILNRMIQTMKQDLKEFERAYLETPDINIGAKASIKAALDEKQEDIIEAEKIATLFKLDESEDIAQATKSIKYECEQLNRNIEQANQEIAAITNRLTSKKSGLIDITSRNKDKDILKELAQTVVDIKHRRQFPETPIEIITRLEEELKIELVKEINEEDITETSTIENKDYDEFLKKEEREFEPVVAEEIDIIEDPTPQKKTRRGVKVIEEAEIATPEEIEQTEEHESKASQDLKEAISEINNLEELASQSIEPEQKSEPETSSEIQDDVIINEEPEDINPIVDEQPEIAPLEIPEEPIIEEQLDESTEEQKEPEAIISETDEDEALNIEEIINQPVIEENVEAEDTQQDQNDLTIGSMFNSEKNYKESSKNDNIVSRENLASELDQYLNNLDNNS